MPTPAGPAITVNQQAPSLPRVDRSFSSVSYARYLEAPAVVLGSAPDGLPDGLCADPLPPLREPVDMPAVSPGTPGPDEPLVALRHARIATPEPYRNEGWEHAGPGTFVRAGVAAALASVAEALAPPWGLVVLDGWRAPALQRELFECAYADASLPVGFVAPPSRDPLRPPAHVSGGAVDLTLSFAGRGLALGTAFDDFSPAARTAAFEDATGPGEASLVRDLRRGLVHAMAAAGFVVLDLEWWHFELGTCRWAALTGGPARYGAVETAPDPDS